MKKSSQAMLTITSVFLAAQIAVMLGLAYNGHYNYIHSVMVTTGFWLVYIFLEARYNLLMNIYVRTLMVLTIFLDAFFGYYYDLYASSFLFDKLLHIFGTYAFSLFSYILVAQRFKTSLPSSVKAILIISLGLTLGTLYEILEFFTDSISHPYPPSQPSLLDTDVDLIGNLVGAVVAAIHAHYRNFEEKNF